MAFNINSQTIKYKRYFSDIRNFYEQRQDVKMFMEILLSLLTIGLFAVFAIRPTFLTIGQLLTEIQNKEETLSKLTSKIQNLRQAQEVYGANTTALALLDTAIPTSPSVDLGVRQIEGVAKKNQVTLSGVSVSETPLKGERKPAKSEKEVLVLPNGAEGVTLSFNVSGSYTNLLTFLSDIQNLRRPIVIDQVLVISSPTSNGNKITLTVSGRSIYEK